MSRSLWSQAQALAAVSGVVKATPGELFSIFALNNNASDRYVQLFDSAAAPAGGAVPKLQWKVPGGGGEIVIGTDFFTDAGVAFDAAGISFGFSTTRATYTAATAADHDFMAVYG